MCNHIDRYALQKCCTWCEPKIFKGYLCTCMHIYLWILLFAIYHTVNWIAYYSSQVVFSPHFITEKTLPKLSSSACLHTDTITHRIVDSLLSPWSRTLIIKVLSLHFHTPFPTNSLLSCLSSVCDEGFEFSKCDFTRRLWSLKSIVDEVITSLFNANSLILPGKDEVWKQRGKEEMAYYAELFYRKSN